MESFCRRLDEWGSCGKGGMNCWAPLGQMLELKLQHLGHLMRRADSLEKTLMLGGTGGRRRRGWQRMRWLDGITDSMHRSLGKLGIGDGQGGLACWDSWGHKESDTTEWLYWTELNVLFKNLVGVISEMAHPLPWLSRIWWLSNLLSDHVLVLMRSLLKCHLIREPTYNHPW